MKSERVAVGEVDDRVSATNELKLKLGQVVLGQKSWFRSTPASKNSAAWAKPLVEDLYGQGKVIAAEFTTAVPLVESRTVPVAGSPLFQVKEVIVADPLLRLATSRRSPFTWWAGELVLAEPSGFAV